MVEVYGQYGVYSGNISIKQGSNVRGISAQITVLSDDGARIEKNAWINDADILVKMILLNDQQGFCWVRFVDTNGPSKRIISIPDNSEYEHIEGQNPGLAPEKKKRKAFTKNTASVFVSPINGVINVKRATLDLIRDDRQHFSYALLICEENQGFIRFLQEHQSGAISLSRGKNNTVKISGKEDIIRWLSGFSATSDAEDFLVEIEPSKPDLTIRLIPQSK